MFFTFLNQVLTLLSVKRNTLHYNYYMKKSTFFFDNLK